jgi:hypothetical protein
VLDYHALFEDLRLMTIANPCVSALCPRFQDMRLTSYILKRPELTFLQVATPVAMEYNCEECS